MVIITKILQLMVVYEMPYYKGYFNSNDPNLKWILMVQLT